MKETINIGIIGDYDENSTSHKATNRAIYHAACQSPVEADITWLPTPSFLTPEGKQKLEKFDGILIAPGTYQKPVGALQGIRTAREMNIPFIGT